MINGKRRKKVPEINSSSTADIAFLLLIFFLITTSMETDSGLARQLPRPPEENLQEEMQLKERNVLRIYLNFNNEIMCGEDYINISDIRQRAKIFISNPTDDEALPEKQAVDIPFFGSMMVTKNHIISLRCDRGTSYKAYIAVQNELIAAYNELRDEISRSKWGKAYSSLNKEQRKAVREIYPQRISEAEPQNMEDRKNGQI